MHRLPQRTLATAAPSRYRRHRHPILCHNKQPSPSIHRRSFSPFGLGGGSTSRSSVVPFPHPEPVNEPPNFGHHDDSPLSPSRRLVTPFSTTTVLPSPTSDDSSRTKHPQFGMGQRRHRRECQDIIVPPDGSSCPASELSTTNSTLAPANNKAQRSADEKRPQRRQKKKKTVAFGTVQVREYVMCLGDNPACESGPPLSLSWEYSPHPRGDRDVMEYEKRRVTKRGAGGHTPKLRGTQLKLPPEARRAILRRLGESEERMDRAAEELRRIRTDREESSSSAEEEDDSELVGQQSPPKLVGHPHKLGELYSISLTIMKKILYA